MRAMGVSGAVSLTIVAWASPASSQDMPIPPDPPPRTSSPPSAEPPAPPTANAAPEPEVDDDAAPPPGPSDPPPTPAPPTPAPEPLPAAAPPAPSTAPLPGAPPSTAPRPGYGSYPVVPVPVAQVHVDADHSDIVLERHLGPNDQAKRGWHVVCHVPCDQPIEAPIGSDFRFSGAGTRASSKFQLGHGYTAFDVEAGSHGQWVGGWVAVGIGSATALAGAIVISTTSPAFQVLGDYDADGYRTRRTVGGVLIGAGIAIGLGLGLPLLLTSRTEYEIVDERAWLDLTADGVALRF